MASPRSLPTRGNTDSSDEAKEGGSTDSIPFREFLKTSQTKGRCISGHFKDMTFRSPSLEALKTKAGYGYSVPGPVHVRRHFPCVFCYDDNIVDHALPRQAPKCFLCLSLLELSKGIVRRFIFGTT